MASVAANGMVLPMRSWLFVLGLALAGCSVTPDETTTSSVAMTEAPPRPTYLALGDSVAFGFDINQSNADETANAIGYPEAFRDLLERDYGKQLGVANTACPGEASGSLITGQIADDNDCYKNRRAYPLHYEYDHQDTPAGAGRSQLDHAVEYIAADPDHVKLVTITAGANDALKYAKPGANWTSAAGAIDAILNHVQPNWETILGALVRAGYRGPVVGVLYYSTGYRWSDFPTMTGIRIINNKIRDAAKAAIQRYPTLNLKLVESYDIFDDASKPFGNDPCAAGLTMRINAPGSDSCDVHPSHLGEQKLAEGIWGVLSASERAALLAN